MEQEIFTLTFTKKEMQEIHKIMETCLFSLEHMIAGFNRSDSPPNDYKKIIAGRNMYRNYVKKFNI